MKHYATETPRTAGEIVDDTNELARGLLKWKYGLVVAEGYQFHDNVEPRAADAWAFASEMMERMTATDVGDALNELDDVSVAAAAALSPAGLVAAAKESEALNAPVTETATGYAFPQCFDSFEIRPCIEFVGDRTESFSIEADFHVALMDIDGEDHKVFWTIYGMEGGIATAIGDFATKEIAHAIMNAMLAPMAKARDILDFQTSKKPENELRKAAIEASTLLDDFINQCSNSERI